ncbi:hypothetical protein KUW19_00890 [Ferrimonas balearica]|uniref:hypothetical protein n=1 Tax=Ferrimonas balearica TaxID=44012 RepID=UPI001C946F78|nr:hypothetical protein [Ferrimonas balearica]MBY6105033.1 hypothetical protein [Ferrimonas balearica]
MGGSSDPEIKDTEAQKALADVAKEQWRIYNESFIPAENQWIANVYSQNDADRYNAVAGTGNLAVQSAFKQMPAQLATGAASRGMGVDSGAFAGGLNTSYTDMASAISAAVNSGQIAQQNKFMTGLGNVAAVGMGAQTQATQSTGNLANMQNQYAINSAQNSAANNMGQQNLAGTAIGMGAGYYMNPNAQNGG